MTDTTPTPTTSRVTIDDVRTALGDTDPNTTNASKIRPLLGNRGSFETIQKHLATLRQERATALNPPLEPGAIPAMPTDAANQMWLAAWSAAQLVTMARTEKLAAERDAALLKLDAMNQDIAGYVSTVDQQAKEMEQGSADMTTEREEHQREIDALTNAGMEYEVQIEALKAEIAEAKNAAKTAETKAANDVAILKLEAENAAQIYEQNKLLMREELSHLTDQIGELKSRLYDRVQPPTPTPLVK